MNMKELLSLVEYLFVLGVPCLSARELFDSGHPILGGAMLVYAFCVILFRHDSIREK